MGSLNALLNLSDNALLANQAAIDITSNNVANQATVGYTREVATWQELDRISLGNGASMGVGAEVTAVSQRDNVLDQMVQQQTQTQSSTSAQSAALNQLQSIFGISSSSTTPISTAIGTDMNAFFNSLSSLQASPSDASLRQGVLSAAQTLASDFNGAASQIGQLNTSLNSQVSGVVGQVNTLTASIASLNLQIESASPNADAGTLEDQRQQDLTQLSQYIGFDQTKTENNGLTLTTTNGSPLVSEGQSFALSTAVVNGNVDLVSSTGQDITQGLTGGSLGGQLQVRDQQLPGFSTQLDNLAYAVANGVNAQNAAGQDTDSNAGGFIFLEPNGPAGAAAQMGVAANRPDEIWAAAPGEGTSGGTNAAAMAALQTQSTPLLNNLAPAAYYASFLTQLGNTVSSVSERSTAQQASLTQLTTQQSSLSGVSLDQEASNLTEYQRSYEAAAKVFSIVDQLMASALNLGEETTVT